MKQVRARAFLLLVGAVLAGLPFVGLGCKGTPKRYAEGYLLKLRLDPHPFTEPALHVVVLLCDDAEGRRAPEFKEKAAIEKWLRDDTDKVKQNLRAMDRMRELNIDTSDRDRVHKVSFQGGEGLGNNAKIFVLVNFATKKDPDKHYFSIPLQDPEVSEYTLVIHPGFLERPPPAPAEGE